MPWVGCYPRIRIATCEMARINNKHRHEPPVWMKAENDRIICELLFHIFPDVLCVLKIERAIGISAVVVNTCESAPSEGASLKLDLIFIEWKIRISFVWSLVSAFLRVIHIQWCTILSFNFQLSEFSKESIYLVEQKNLMKSHIIYDNSVRVLLRLLKLSFYAFRLFQVKLFTFQVVLRTTCSRAANIFPWILIFAKWSD